MRFIGTFSQFIGALQRSRQYAFQYMRYYGIWRKFKRLHPNSRERYQPYLHNVQRWRWHIEQHELRKAETAQVEKWVQDLPENFLKLTEQRRILRWDDFDNKTQGIYRDIADRFTGFPVYACGSRVRGDYVNADDLQEIKEWRKRAGKAEKENSDFDFWTPLNAVQYGELPEYADRLRHGVPENEKILIPMIAWDFTKLPADQHGRVIELYNSGRWNELAALHDKYKLSPYDYCCDLSGLKKWYKHGIDSKKINADSTANNTGV